MEVSSMNRKMPEHWIFESISSDEFLKAFSIADNRLVCYSLGGCCKIDKIDEEIQIKENIHIKNMIELLEMVTIEWSNTQENDTYKLKEIYQQLFYLCKVLPIPNDDIEKIKFIYKLISYAYLGEKWESGRRYLKENDDKCVVNISDLDSWDKKVFKKTYMAFILLIKKSSWNDLNYACDYIRSLREEQSLYEKIYLSSLQSKQMQGRAYELIGLYHFAKAIETMCEFMVNGKSSSDIREQIDFHFEKALESSEHIFNLEMNLILQSLRNTIKQMISNSIWMVTERVNSRVSRFVENITKSNKPIFELLYPQKYSVLEKGLLDPAHKAVVVNLPTSSGKTLLSEFRILQALNQFSDDEGWVAYVAPTKALVNQITLQFKRDLHPIGIKVEKMSGAIELDTFEENILLSTKKQFDILVVTPEKLNLLIRDKIEEKVGRPLALVVVDEAHNIEDPQRGLNLELMMANIKNDCRYANFLLLTPFIPNSDELARWLDPDSPNPIQLQLSWQPNERIVGAFYPEGSRRNWNTTFETLLTSNEQIQIEKKIKIDDITPLNIARSSITKTSLTVAVTKQLLKREGILVICKEQGHCWNCAKMIASEINETYHDEDIELVKRFVASELGKNFILKDLLDKGIGVHHAGLPEEVKYLMEWLMEKGKLKVLVATTTIAQGINFPVSTILMASYSYPYTSEMPTRDFWNLVGRSGRTEQGSIGIVGIAIGDKESNKNEELKKLREYISKSTKELLSNLVHMVDETIENGSILKLSAQFYKPEWSQFLQYITHMFNQCKDLDEFNAKAELFLRRTYGYKFLTPNNKKILLNSVIDYGETLNKHKGLTKLSDSTGFSMEAINRVMYNVKELGLTQNNWDTSSLFNNENTLKNLMGVMLSIPEISDSLQKVVGNNRVQGSTLAQLTMDWVSGKDIEYIAKRYYNGDNYDAITSCCNAIYSKLIHSATWGLASIQKMPTSGIDFDNLKDDEKREISNLPAMIYYGVDSSEAILMRINNIPRTIAKEFGNKFASEVEGIYKTTPSEAFEWIANLTDNHWNSIVGNNLVASGKDYSKIWRIINGDR